jgi:hypothetical protein
MLFRSFEQWYSPFSPLAHGKPLPTGFVGTGTDWARVRGRRVARAIMVVLKSCIFGGVVCEDMIWGV